MPSDHKLVACMQEHEMKTVLKHFKKGATEANVVFCAKRLMSFVSVENREALIDFLDSVITFSIHCHCTNCSGKSPTCLNEVIFNKKENPP
jgi:hypothetical protein